MKKFFGGKKKKKSKAASFISADSDYQVNDVMPRKLNMSHSTEQPRMPLTDDISNLQANTIGKNLVHSKSQGIIKTTIPTQQPAMAKRLNRPTSSPPALVMPRPRYAEPPTRAVLKSFDHEKTQLDLDHGTGLQNRKDDNNLHKVIQPVPSASASIPVKPKKISPITQQYDASRSIIQNKKSFDDPIAMATTKKHESMNSITGSDDSNRVYESALESPMASTSTILDNHGSTHGLAQAQRHSSPSNFNSTLVPSLLPPTASDSSETVTPAGSTHQRVLAPEQISIGSFSSIDITKPVPQNTTATTSPTPTHHQRPLPISPTRNHHDLNPSLPSEDLETLQQQVLLIQQQREMDRLEYERMEQIHKERTKWMKAEIDRTQSKLMELTAQKRASQPQFDSNLVPSPSFSHHQADISMSNGNREISGDESIRRHHHSSASSTPSRPQKSKSELSRSSSKTSTGSSIGRSGYRPKGDIKPTDTRSMEDGPSRSDHMADSYTNVSRQSSGRKPQQQDYQPASLSKGTPRTRQTRPRSKSTESRLGPDMDYFYDEPPQVSRGRSNQRSHSVERPLSFYPGQPYFYPTPDDFDDDGREEEEDDEEYLEPEYPLWYDTFAPPPRQQRVRPYPPPPMPGPFLPYRPPRISRSINPAYYDTMYYPPMRQQRPDDPYWPPSRYPPYMRMDDPQRRMDDPQRRMYWRGRPADFTP